MRVSVIIPTRNEAQAIGRVLADIPSDLVHEVIVVDNHSTDGTPDIAARMGARVILETTTRNQSNGLDFRSPTGVSYYNLRKY